MEHPFFVPGVPLPLPQAVARLDEECALPALSCTVPAQRTMSADLLTAAARMLSEPRSARVRSASSSGSAAENLRPSRAARSKTGYQWLATRASHTLRAIRGQTTLGCPIHIESLGNHRHIEHGMGHRYTSLRWSMWTISMRVWLSSIR